jgi:hypothetical protein
MLKEPSEEAEKTCNRGLKSLQNRLKRLQQRLKKPAEEADKTCNRGFKEPAAEAGKEDGTNA